MLTLVLLDDIMLVEGRVLHIVHIVQMMLFKRQKVIIAVV